MEAPKTKFHRSLKLPSRIATVEDLDALIRQLQSLRDELDSAEFELVLTKL
jgi:hypothetical protein